MQKDTTTSAGTGRPLTVTIAVAMLAISLLIRLYGEVSLAYLAAQATGDFGFQLGRAAIPIGFYLIQGLVLWHVAKGRNWARIAMIALVLLNVVVAILVLNSPLGHHVNYLVIPLLQIVVETLAVILLLFSYRFFSRRPGKPGPT